MPLSRRSKIWYSQENRQDAGERQNITIGVCAIVRRSDREVTSLEQIKDILIRCDTIRIGISDEPAPFVVPVSFGMEEQDGVICVYFHSALAGRKAELLKKKPLVCIEADLCHGFVESKGGVTCDFESVIGYGVAEQVEGMGKLRGLQLLLEHCGKEDYQCTPEVTAATAVYRIQLRDISGKRRFCSQT